MTTGTSVRLASCAVFIVAAFGVCHVAGLRESTSFLCRIDITTQPSHGEMFSMGLYLASYLGAVLVSPILAIAAALHVAVEGARAPRPRE